MADKYVAYVGSYSYSGSAKGITIYDVDVMNGTFSKKTEVDVNNSSYLAVSNSGKYLYSIADEGIISFEILSDGGLKQLNTASIRGMRGCYLSVDAKDEYIFVSGYHDGKASILKLEVDGSVGQVTDGVFHKSIGSISDRSFHPRINCTILTPDQNFLCVVDLGLDQVLIYKFDHVHGTIHLADILRCELESAPRHIVFSEDARYMYLISEIKNYISVYSYRQEHDLPIFELVQTIPTTGSNYSSMTAACAMKLSADQKHIICSNAGDNSVGIFERDHDTGMLHLLKALPISGDYPKDIAIFPDDKHLVSVNHVSDELTFFNIDYINGLISMNASPIKVDEPNCCLIIKIK